MSKIQQVFVLLTVRISLNKHKHFINQPIDYFSYFLQSKIYVSITDEMINYQPTLLPTLSSNDKKTERTRDNTSLIQYRIATMRYPQQLGFLANHNNNISLTIEIPKCNPTENFQIMRQPKNVATTKKINGN